MNTDIGKFMHKASKKGWLVIHSKRNIFIWNFFFVFYASLLSHKIWNHINSTTVWSYIPQLISIDVIFMKKLWIIDRNFYENHL